MKQTIEIEVPDGKKAVWENGKIVFVDNNTLPKTWEEFCEHHKVSFNECYIDCNSKIRQNVDSRTPYQQRNIIPSKQDAEAHLALMQLHQLRDCYRQGWKPDWNDSSYKYCIDNYRNCYTMHEYQSLKHFLAFQSNEIAKEFLNNFCELIKEAGDLI